MYQISLKSENYPFVFTIKQGIIIIFVKNYFEIFTYDLQKQKCPLPLGGKSINYFQTTITDMEIIDLKGKKKPSLLYYCWTNCQM